MLKKTKKNKVLFKSWTKRRWLNSIKDGGTAFIKMHVSNIDDNDEWEEASGTIDISDCSRIITLEFSPINTTNFSNAIGKLDTLMMSLGEFRGKLQDAMDAAIVSRANAAKQEKE